jgi:hypothetical protein
MSEQDSSSSDSKSNNSNDFGIKAGDATAAQYASSSTLHQDPGHAVERSGTGERTSGVGGNDSGRGSSSGGDIDTGADALVGLGDPSNESPTETQTIGRPEDRPTLDKPITAQDPVPGHLQSDSSTSADGINNETKHTNEGFKGDVTMDEAAGNSSK